MAAPPSFAAMAAREQQKKAPLEKVQVEGQVILKIAQHCSQNEGATISTGQLLGLDVGGTLEVTDCFPYPVRAHWAAACAHVLMRSGRIGCARCCVALQHSAWPADRCC